MTATNTTKTYRHYLFGIIPSVVLNRQQHM